MKAEWLTPPEVAAMMRVTVGTLANWRHRGAGPRYVKLSDTPKAPVRYSRDDVETYLRKSGRGAVA